VLAGDGLNRDGYISSGAERTDSVGEPSNLTAGEAAPFQAGISDMVVPILATQCMTGKRGYVKWLLFWLCGLSRDAPRFSVPRSV
jgi:hypothetical protein